MMLKLTQLYSEIFINFVWLKCIDYMVIQKKGII